jgi:hypothetical protein
MEKDLQRIELKMLVDGPAQPDLDPLLAAFDRWRKQENAPSEWIDLADYAHMPKGPGVMMAGKRENFGVNLIDPGPGIFFTGKKNYAGSTADRFVEAFRRCLKLAKTLLAEPDYPAALQPKTGEWLVVVNDRLDFPNDDDTDGEIRPGLETALNRLFGEGRFTLTRDEDPAHRLGYHVRAAAAPSLDELTSRANS